MERLLLFPPFADPTQAYPSLPTLKGHLRAAGLDARTLDLNVEAIHFLLRRDSLETLGREVGRRFSELNRRDRLTFAEAREYRALAGARTTVEALLDADPPPLEVFRTRELFFDAARYTRARGLVEGLLEAVGAARHPLRLGFNRASPGILPWSFDLLEAHAAGPGPLDGLYEEVFDGAGSWETDDRPPLVPLEGIDFVGISVAFPSQIPESLRIARMVRDRAPRAFVALGGPCIHQVALGLDEDGLGRLLAHADGVGIFEGEETLVRLFPLLEAWRETPAPARAEVLAEVPNLLVAGGEGGVRRGPLHVVDLSEAAEPDWSDIDLDRYLAPDRLLLYAPTRGCYWNRCSFCRYGLSETSTARYREVPPERAAAQLGRLSKRHGFRNVYLSCDVLSPSYAARFAAALLERKLKIRWSTDLKVEASYDAERCALLHRAGLRAAAFGMESGSDRVLALIDKGCRREIHTEVNRRFHEAGIATAWMTFTGHPGETVEEALETLRWIETEEERVDLFMVGEFSLEAGSRIHLDPGRFGIERIYRAEGDDLRLYPLHVARGDGRRAGDRERLEEEIRRIAAPYALRPYPWAGAISTHHSFLHFLELGPRAFRTHFRGVAGEGADREPRPSGIAGLRERPRFPVEEIAGREDRFVERYLREALRPVPGGDGGPDRAPLSKDHLDAAEAREEPFIPDR